MTRDQQPTPDGRAVLELVHLKKHFDLGKTLLSRATRTVHAVDDISLTIGQGETLGLVGESGCGKSTVGRMILWLTEPTGGQVLIDGEDLSTLSRRALRRLRQKVQIVFQDPFASLNPRMTAFDIVAEPLVVQNMAKGSALRQQVTELFDKVGLPVSAMEKHAHEFSGGQRQRIGIAKALALRPSLIVCDEAVSALDVSIQAQIVNLLIDLQDEYGLSFLFISHDLSVVNHISHRVAVMYLGKIVEAAPNDTIFARPLHPYTEALLSATPSLDPDADRSQRIVLVGDVPNPLLPPTGCHFHPRCRYAMPRCALERPALREIAPGHHVACHLHDEGVVWPLRKDPMKLRNSG